MPILRQRIQRLDRAQQRDPRLGITFATLKKYSEDRSSGLASMIAFWAFFSIFPLILVAVTLLGFFLSGGARASVLGNIAKLFPLLNPQGVGGLTGSWWAVIVGGVTALWSGLAVVKWVQTSFNSVWEIPEANRPGLVEKVWRSLVGLAAVGGGLVLATVISSFITGNQTAINLAWYSRLGGYVVSFLLDVGVFMLAFRILTSKRVTWAEVKPGALLAGGSFWVLQQISSLIISRYLNNAQSTYGHFATVITMLWWFYLQAQITLLGAQLNVVLKERLWPRSLRGAPETEADRRALEAYAEEGTYHERQEVDVRFRDSDRERERR